MTTQSQQQTQLFRLNFENLMLSFATKAIEMWKMYEGKKKYIGRTTLCRDNKKKVLELLKHLRFFARFNFLSF